jgi:hypothetical protein
MSAMCQERTSAASFNHNHARIGSPESSAQRQLLHGLRSVNMSRRLVCKARPSGESAMLPEFKLPSGEECPISDELLGVLYRSNPHGLSALVTSVGPETRAILALYCYRRAHLQDMGLSIAATCEEANLLSFGAAGGILFSRSREAPHKSIVNYYQARRTITLSTGPSKRSRVVRSI